MSERPRFYEHPPIIERVASVYTEMSDELFESRFDDWSEEVKREFPHDEAVKQWLMPVREKEGVPIFETMQPELRITPRFSKKKEREGFDWSIRCPCGQFTMNLHSSREEGITRRYGTLRNSVAEWLPRWMQHFEVSSATKISLTYVNALTTATLPEFFDKEERLALDQVLTVFAGIPGNHTAVVPPFHCEVNVKLADLEDAKLGIELTNWSNPRHGRGLRLDFDVDILPPEKRPLGSTDILSLLDWAYERIIDRFEVVFTEQAKASFGPVTS
jgi:hypothetical protein